MSRLIWMAALLLAAPWPVQAQIVNFPPFVSGGGDGTQMIVPQCRLAGATMNCQLLVLTVTSFPHASRDICHVHVHAENVTFRRENATTWAGDLTTTSCRIRTMYRLVSIAGTPRRVAFRLSFEVLEKTEACLKADREMREGQAPGARAELEWVETSGDKPLPLALTGCKSFTMGPGQFPAQAFPR